MTGTTRNGPGTPRTIAGAMRNGPATARAVAATLPTTSGMRGKAP